MSNGHGLVPSPFLTTVSLVLDFSDPEKGVPGTAHFEFGKLVFREDYFDPVTRIRRGRIYRYKHYMQWYALAHPIGELSQGDTQITGHGNYRKDNVHTFESVRITELFSAGSKRVLALGIRGQASLWNIVSAELISTGEDLVTLKSRFSFGVLPELSPFSDTELEGRIRNRLEKVEDSVNRAGPEAIIDQCREAAVAILGGHLNETWEKPVDLANLSERIASKGFAHVSGAALMINRLHSRTKFAEQASRGLRIVTDHDADTAIHCLGSILCDLKLGVSRCQQRCQTELVEASRTGGQALPVSEEQYDRLLALLKRASEGKLSVSSRRKIIQAIVHKVVILRDGLRLHFYAGEHEIRLGEASASPVPVPTGDKSGCNSFLSLNGGGRAMLFEPRVIRRKYRRTLGRGKSSHGPTYRRTG